MSELTLTPDLDTQAGDKLISVPTLIAATPVANALHRGDGARSLRRRFTATRQLRATDSEFRLFRVY